MPYIYIYIYIYKYICLASGAHDEKWAPDGILKGKINHVVKKFEKGFGMSLIQLSDFKLFINTLECMVQYFIHYLLPDRFRPFYK